MANRGMGAGDVIETVLTQSQRVLNSYRADPGLIQEHANSERRITQGGYGSRQLYELVQNGADEMREQDFGGRIQVVLTGTHLYCANQGTPVTSAGAETILRMSVSRKRGRKIGRFGVGVKSVLSVSDTPQFFSTTGAFGFDREWSAREIRAVEPSAEETPVLRMARELNVERERAADPVLDELMQWAATVVRLPLLDEMAVRLGKDIRRFPAEFQLFSPHVGDLVLEDRCPRPIFRRSFTVVVDGPVHRLSDGSSGAKLVEKEWRVFARTYSPSPAVRESAGELHDRDSIDISWAVPEYTRSSSGLLTVPAVRGVFWSFFPTEFDTTLRGKINAAWKTNEDRQALLNQSPLNNEMIAEAARLVVESLPELVDEEDAAAYLHLLPGRAKESPNWACAHLTGEIWKQTAARPSLPDQDGVLRKPSEVKVHPEGLRANWLKLWTGYARRPKNWVHHSIDNHRDRRGKVAHILEAAGGSPTSIKDWLEALVGDGTPTASRTAIAILDDMIAQDLAMVTQKLATPAMAAQNSAHIAEAKKAKIVLTERHGLVAPAVGQVFQRAKDDGLHDDFVYVHPDVQDGHGMSEMLGRIGVHEADTAGRFAAVLEQGFAGYQPDSWMRFWELMRAVNSGRAVQMVKGRLADPMRQLRVRTVAGTVRPLHNCLLPGRVVPGDGSRDAHVAVDPVVHSDDIESLRALGVCEIPTSGHRPEDEPWFSEYRDDMFEQYCSTRYEGARRRPSAAQFQLTGASTAGPLHALLELSDEGRAAFVECLPDDGVSRNWTSQFGRKSSAISPVASPISWLISREGRFRTSRGIVAKNGCVSPELRKFADVLPVANISLDKARKLELPGELGKIPEPIWQQVLENVAESEDDGYIGQVYSLLLDAPEHVIAAINSGTRCRVGSGWDHRADSDIAVAATKAEFDDLVAERCPAILVPNSDTAEAMINAWGMLRPADVISREVRAVPEGEPVLLVDEFPALRLRFGANIGSIQYCSELEHITRTPNGMTATALPVAKQGNTILMPRPALELDALVAVDTAMQWGLGAAGCRRLLDRYELEQQQVALQEARQQVRRAESVIDKVLLLIGPDTLRGGLPDGLLESERAENGGRAPAPRRIAELAYNAHGDEILKVHSKTITATYPDAPHFYDGSPRVLKFVADRGFPDSFAGARVPSLSTREIVHGPREFPALHGYQEKLATNLVDLLIQKTPRRAMLVLPTGAGKTRVTAEGVIRWIRQEGTLPGPILWVAQTEELCEQAVQSWKFVWEKVGAEANLTISRLWSGNEDTATTGHQLVVATDAKLRSCLNAQEYGWLRESALVIIDEAHIAYSPSYTELLKLLGITYREAGRHLIGLTATAFRGRNEEETRLLAQRFGNRRLDHGVFSTDELEDAYRDLQRLGVLARVEHHEIAGGELRLTDKEQSEARRMFVLPKAAEQRLADDHDRNNRLLEQIEDMPKNWPVLFFATSVAHAKFMAAKLNGRGIKAAAIDSATSPPTRRDRIEGFRDGRIRVLTNYGVLTQGFDAPATRAVVVARPVYSPNVYQQMIGRGLRGPANGGKQTCLILNVRDNIENFGEQLAFTGFEYLWKEDR